MTSSAETDLSALERRVSEVTAEIGECVAGLLAPGTLPRFVVAERLVPLGSALVPHLLAILKDPLAGEDLRGCAAFLGFTVGDREQCAMALFDQIEADGPWALGAARKLADTGYPGTAFAIEAALRRIDAESFDTAVGYLHALSTASGVLPEDLRTQLSASKHWQLTTAVNELFPLGEPSR